MKTNGIIILFRLRFGGRLAKIIVFSEPEAAFSDVRLDWILAYYFSHIVCSIAICY